MVQEARLEVAGLSSNSKKYWGGLRDITWTKVIPYSHLRDVDIADALLVALLMADEFFNFTSFTDAHDQALGLGTWI